MTAPIDLDGYVMLKRDDLQSLIQTSRQLVPEPDPPDRLLTVREAARQLNLSPSAVHNYISSHQLPVIRLGRAVRIEPADLAEFIAQRRQNAQHPHAGQRGEVPPMGKGKVPPMGKGKVPYAGRRGKVMNNGC